MTADPSTLVRCDCLGVLHPECKEPICVFCTLPTPYSEYMANDHACDDCSAEHNALLAGERPRLKS